jgi:hypothetical protein
VALGAIACLWAGCGTQEYQARMVKRIDELGKEVSTGQLFGYLPAGQGLAADRVNVRVPLAFKEAYNEQFRDLRTQQPAAPEMLYPLGIPLPGYDRTYVARLRDPQGTEWAYYLYLGAILSDNDDIESVADELQAKLSCKFEDIPSLTPDRKTFKWKKTHIDAKLSFDTTDAAKNYAWLETDGTIELYLCGGNEHVVLFGWRTPNVIKEASKMEKLAPLIGQSLKITAPPEDAADGN